MNAPEEPTFRYRLTDRVEVDLGERRPAHGTVTACAGDVYEVRLDDGELIVIIGGEPPSRAER